MKAGEPKYKRIVLKLSGEALARPGHFGIDEEALASAAGEIAPLLAKGVQVALVMGGGNFFRGRQLADSQRVARTTADTIGMLATTMNALALRDCLESIGVPARVMGTVTTPTVCEPYISRKAMDHLEHHRVVILAGGTGSPFFTTDTTAALRAAELGGAMLKATKVDGVFSADPQRIPEAKRFAKLTYHEVLKQRLGVMDLTAVSLCMEARVPVVVFKFTTAGNTLAAVMGEDVGTTIVE
jgi:uridylate kinase